MATVPTQPRSGRYEVSAVVQLGEASARERAFFTIADLTRAERGP
jgi:hypothetical protein